MNDKKQTGTQVPETEQQAFQRMAERPVPEQLDLEALNVSCQEIQVRVGEIANNTMAEVNNFGLRTAWIEGYRAAYDLFGPNPVVEGKQKDAD